MVFSINATLQDILLIYSYLLKVVKWQTYRNLLLFSALFLFVSNIVSVFSFEKKKEKKKLNLNDVSRKLFCFKTLLYGYRIGPHYYILNSFSCQVYFFERLTDLTKDNIRFYKIDTLLKFLPLFSWHIRDLFDKIIL